MKFKLILILINISFILNLNAQIFELNGINLNQKASDVPYDLLFQKSFSAGNNASVVSGHTNEDASSCTILWDNIYTFNSNTEKWQRFTSMPYPRIQGVFFEVNNIYFVGLGVDNNLNLFSDFNKYDPATQTWSSCAAFPAGGLVNATCMVINGKAYITCGQDTNNPNNKTWEYDPATDVWTQKSDFPSTSRISCTSWSINGYGYIGNGYSGPGYENDTWKYDPVADSWTPCQPFPGSNSHYNHSFSIDSTGYVRTEKQFWAYSTTQDLWTQKNNFPDTIYDASAISTNSNGYVFLLNKFYKYDPVNDSWTDLYQPNNVFPPSIGLAKGISFDNKGFILGRIYDPFNDSWTKDTTGATWLFANNNKGYAKLNNLFQEYDPSTHTWNPKNLPPAVLDFPRGVFNINQTEFVIEYTNDSNLTCILWKYDSSNDNWIQLDTIPFLHSDPPYSAWDPIFSSFATGGKGFIAFSKPVGQQTNNDLWEYDASLNSWTQKTNFPGHERFLGFAQGTSQYAYVGLGNEDQGPFNPSDSTIYKYDPVADTWSVHGYIHERIPGLQFTINDVPFVGGGGQRVSQNCDDIEFNDFYSIDSVLINIVAENKIENDKLVLYPNPASGIIHIDSHSGLQARLFIFNIDGKMIRQITQPFNSIDIHELATGTYHLMIVDNNCVLNRRFVVVH